MKKIVAISMISLLLLSSADLMGQHHHHASGNHVVIVDENLPALDILLQGIKPGSRLVYLEKSQNPLLNILRIIRDNAPISSLHIFSHAKPGSLVFGSQEVTIEDLEQNEKHLGSWKEYFITHGDVLLYGCEVAKGTDGIEFIRTLAVLTGLDIAASDNLTGSYLKGGDWYFEVRSGRIESSLIISKRITAQYAAVLND
jgi:hypothetical protein